MLTPNPTDGRLKFILKTYGEKRPDVVMAMVDIVARTVGFDQWARVVMDAATNGDATDEGVRFFREMGDYLETGTRSRSVTTDLATAVVTMLCELPKFRSRHRADPTFAWMAAQLSKVSPADFSLRSFELARKGTTIAMWYERTRPNLGEYSLKDAIHDAEKWVEEEGPVPQGEIVAKLSDGWTAQKLTTDEQLNVEGERMQHCVGSYAREVKAGETTIYSLRDAKGHPHVTIEVKNGRVYQTKGKQNDAPAKKYKPYVEEFNEWLEEKGVSLHKIPPHLVPYVDALEQHGGADIDEEHIEWLAQEWREAVGSPEAIIAWLQAGISDSDPQLAEALVSEDLTPDEFNGLPYAVTYKIFENGGVPNNLDDLIAVGRLAVVLAELAPLRTDEKRRSTAQATLFEEPRAEKRRPGQDPIGKRMIKPQWGGADARLRDPSISFGAWDEEYHLSFGAWDEENHRGDGDDILWLYPAEEWYAHTFTADQEDDAYVGPWFQHGFTPDEATEWWEAGVQDGHLAAELRARRLTPKKFSELPTTRSLDEFEALKEKASRKWLRTKWPDDDPDGKVGLKLLHEEYARYAKVIAQQIAEEADEAGIRRNPKKRTSRGR